MLADSRNGGSNEVSVCGEDTTKVIDSRPSDDNTAIRRRRMCEVCNRRFTTYEKIEVFPLMVVKKDQTREAYSREKLKNWNCYGMP